MTIRVITAALFLITLMTVAPLSAAETPPQADYSRQALLQIFGDFYTQDRQKSSSLDWDVTIGHSKLHLRFVPLMLPFLFGAPVGDLMPPVVPSELLHVSVPSTKAMYSIDDRDVAKAIRQIERRRAREARLRD